MYPEASDAQGVSVEPGTYTIQAGVSEEEGEDADAAAVTFGPLNLNNAAGARFFNFVTGLLSPGQGEFPLFSFIIVTSVNGDFDWDILYVEGD